MLEGHVHYSMYISRNINVVSIGYRGGLQTGKYIAFLRRCRGTDFRA